MDDSGNDFYVRPLVEAQGVGTGSSYDTAWNGLKNIDWTELGPGTTLFVCGEHRGEILLLSASGNSAQDFIIDGDCLGDPGVIDGSRDLSQAAAWQRESAQSNLWKTVEAIEEEVSRGPGWIRFESNGQDTMVYTKDEGLNSYQQFADYSDLCGDGTYGNLMTDDVDGDCMITLDDLVTNGDAWWDRTSMWVYSDGGLSPAERYSNVRVPVRYMGVGNVIDLEEYAGAETNLYHAAHVTIRNLLIRHTTTLGLRLSQVNNITVDNVTVEYLGGGVSAVTARSGNGIQFDGNGSHAVRIQNSTARQVFEAGLAFELHKTGTDELAYDIRYEDNLIEYCGAGLSIATHKPQDSRIYNVTIARNQFYGLGDGWSGWRDDENVTHGNGILIQEASTTDGSPAPDVYDVTIEDNVIDGFNYIAIYMRQSHAVIKGNIIRNGSGNYLTGAFTPPAAIAIHGNDYMSVPGTTLENEATGLVMNNLIYNNNTHGLFVANNTPDVTFEPEARTLAELQDYDLKIIGNTFYMNGLDEVPGAVPFAEGNASIKIRTSSATIFKNNVVYCKQDTLCVDASDHGNQFNELNYNLYFKEPESGPSWKWGSQVFDYEEFSDYQNQADGREGNSLVVNPQFVDDAAENFQLGAGSPASGQGFAIIDDWSAVGERNGLLPGSDWPNNVIKVNQAKYPGWAIGAFVE